MSTKICLITPGHISSNPRLVKEAMALSEAGMQVHIIFTQYMPYLQPYDKKILLQHPEWTYDVLNWTKTGWTATLNYYKSAAFQKLSKFINNQLSIKGACISLNRHFHWQLRKAKLAKADLYVAHNLGALPIAAKAAKYNHTKYAFDAEDFHRNESTDDSTDERVKITALVEDSYLMQANYITAASPMIADRYATLYKKQVSTILNVLPKVNSSFKQETKDLPLKLFWFSQTIGPARGLEAIIEAVGHSKLNCELHLLGHITHTYKQELIQQTEKFNLHSAQLEFHNSIFADDIPAVATHFDIGLASEPTTPANRDICLTNKLFTYIQCGLAVAASHTSAQADFMAHHPGTGKLYSSATELAIILSEYHHNRQLLNETKEYCFALGQTGINWETEKCKLLNTVNSCLTQHL